MRPDCPWIQVSSQPALGDGDVHVWRIQLDARGASLAASFLTDEEQARRNRMPDVPGNRFAIARAATRTILGAYLKVAPRHVPIIPGTHGKLQLPDRALYFNGSHAGDFALLAVCRHAELGVDIEKVDPARALHAIAERFFSVAEKSALATRRGDDFVRAFFRCWSRKEAVIKALGEGLACPLGLFDVSLDEGTASLLAFRRADVDPSQWTMASLSANPGYEAALAVIGPIEHFAGFEYGGQADYLSRTA